MILNKNDSLMTNFAKEVRDNCEKFISKMTDNPFIFDYAKHVAYVMIEMADKIELNNMIYCSLKKSDWLDEDVMSKSAAKLLEELAQKIEEVAKVNDAELTIMVEHVQDMCKKRYKAWR